MGFRRPASVAGLACAFCLTSCNVFQGIFATGPESGEDHVVEGQKFLQQAKYEEALAEFEAALAQDSGLSEAYVGAAKSVLLARHINVFALLETFQKQDGKSIPFVAEADSLKDKLYGANRGINKYLGALIRIEKSGRSDGRVASSSVAADYALASTIEAILSLADFNGDGHINSKDNILDGIIDLKNPANLTPEKIMANLDSIKNDTVKIQALNSLLDKSKLLLDQSDKAVDLFINSLSKAKDTIPCPPDNPACKAGVPDTLSDSALIQVKKFIHDAGATVVIYKIQDRIDNDGDGCGDEELLDGIDNDGDGKVDEDSRGIPDTVGNPRFYADKDGGDNDGNGAIDDGFEAQFHLRFLASVQPIALIQNPDRKGQIFWKDSAGTQVDSRRVVILTDSSFSPPAKDTVTTLDLCRGKVTGFKLSPKAAP